MKTNHVNFPNASGKVYCHRMNSIADLTQKFMATECMSCPYYAGDMLGHAVECLFDDACKEKEISFFDPYESEKHSQMQYVRLGLKTAEEVENSLQAMGGNMPLEQSNEIDKK